MAKLYFKVGSDWEEVVKLRNEISKLKQELKSMDSTQSPAAFKTLNTQLAASTQRMDELVTNAAKAGAVMEGDFKKKIFTASQSVNGFIEKIITQKAVVKDVEADVKRLGEAYRSALKNNPLSANSKLSEYTSAKKALDEEKASLFGLTQQQAEARLSVKKLRDEYSLYKDEAKETVEANNGIAVSWKRALAVIGGATALKAFGSEMIRVRGQFQAANTAIQILLGSKEKADKLMAQVREYAKISPLEFSDVTSATQMMLGFNIEAEKVPRYLQAIGDVSMGDTQRFNSLTLAFSQMTAAGKLMGQDLNQMINAGFNPLQIMAEKTGKSIATLKDEMSKGAISAEMVQQAFIDATSAGGKFFGMSENASKTINGQLSMMRDAMDNAFNEMGQKSEGVIMKGIQMTTSLIQNYEIVGKVLAGLIATYGTYRTALMLSTVATSKLMSVELSLNRVRALARISQMALNKAVSANPYVLAATALMGLVSSLYIFSDTTSVAEKAQKNFNNSIEYQKILLENLKKNIDQYVSIVRDETLSQYDKIKAYEQLKELMPTVFSNMDIEKLKLMDILSLNEQISNEIAKRERIGAKTSLVLRQKELESVSLRLDNAVERQAQSPTAQNSAVIAKLQQEKKRLEKEVELAKKNVDEIIELQNKTNKTEKDSNYKQDYEKAQKDWEDAKKKLSEIEKDKSKFTSKQYEEAKKRVETTEKAYKDLGGATGGKLTKQENQADKDAEEQLKQQEQLSEQLLSIRRKNQQDEINLREDGTEKKLAQIDLDYQKELDTIRKQEQEWTKINGGKLTEEQSSQISISYSQSESKRDKALSEVNKEEIEAMNRYLKEYGTFQQKKESITKEYTDKIAKASTEGEKASLKKESENKIKEVNFEELKSSINFADIFGNLDSQSTEAITRMRDKLKEIINKSAKDLKPTDLKALQDAFKDIELKISERKPFGELKQGADDYKNATQAVIKAQEDLNIVQQGGEVIIGTYIDKTGKLCTKLLTQEQAEKNLSDAQMKRLESQGKLTKAVNSIGQQGQQLVNAGNNLVDMLTNLGVEVPESISGALAGLGQIMSGLESIDLTKPFSVISSTTGILSGFVQTITSFFGGPNGTSYYEGVKEQLEAINEVYDRIINKSREEITFGGGFASVQASTQALDNYYKKVANLQTIADASGRAGASWKSHSAEWHSNKNVGAGNFEQMSQILGKSIQSMDDLYYLTGDELYLIQSQLPEAWSQIDSRIKENLQSIIDCKDEANELRDALNQAMTGIDFDSFYSGFIDQLSDIDTSFEDMCDNFEGYLRKSIMAGLVASQYQGRIEKLYQEWSDAARSDNKITEDEADALQDRYKQIVSDMMKDREEMFNSFGWDSGSSSQESTKKGFATASQDSIDELNGRFTAGQIAWEETKNQNILQSQSLNILTVKADSILSINTDTRNIADEIRTIQANSFLELQGIRENTGAIIKPIKDIAADIAEVKKNISKL